MNKDHNPGFTLVELLTVVAIIAILAAILIPTVGSIRRSALQTESLSNIRQVGLAYLLVAQDNNGELPSIHGASKRDMWDRKVNAIITDGGYEDYPNEWSNAFHDTAAIHDGTVSPNVKYHFAPLGAVTRGNGDENGGGAAPKALRRCNNLMRQFNPGRQILLADAGVDSPTGTPWGDLLHSESFSWSGSWSGNYNPSNADKPIDPGTGGAAIFAGMNMVRPSFSLWMVTLKSDTRMKFWRRT
ncbi:type II secretion system protein [Cerasicoccus frondis]|uniref:type II secretion system protein n=1 Tax=Cerasicoccus frondis TaxID=490090 RepID=UPI0028525B4B|nr:prepilin-type N-terminal cleavage/methylation domain-containing protein [Cerasicoccus frondis]